MNLKLEALVLSILTGAVVVLVPNVASATKGAKLSLLPPEYVELDTHPDDYTDDRDGHADDLMVTFSETGVGNNKVVDITVTAVREVTMTCVSTLGDFPVSVAEPVSAELSENDSTAVASYSVDDEKGQLTGTVALHTIFRADVCAQYNSAGDESRVYAVKDYSLTYTDITVTDNENGGASATIDRAEPGYTDSTIIKVGFQTEIAGTTCTIESLEQNHCGAS